MPGIVCMSIQLQCKSKAVPDKTKMLKPSEKCTMGMTNLNSKAHCCPSMHCSLVCLSTIELYIYLKGQLPIKK